MSVFPSRAVRPLRAERAMSPRRLLLSCSSRILQSIGKAGGIAVLVLDPFVTFFLFRGWPSRSSHPPSRNSSFFEFRSSHGLRPASECDPYRTASSEAGSPGVLAPRQRSWLREATCTGVSVSRLRCVFRFSQPLDAFFLPRPPRLCFIPMTLLGFSLQRIPLPLAGMTSRSPCPS
jgi:hypothetical protein